MEQPLLTRLPRLLLLMSFAGAEALHHAASQSGCEVHPGGVESVEIVCEAPAGVPGAVERPEHAERAGKGDPEASGPAPSATVVDDHRGPEPERQRDRLSLSGI